MANIDANVNLNLGGASLLGGGSNLESSMYEPVIPPIGGGGGSDSILQMEQEMLQIMEQMMQLLEQLEGGSGGGNPYGGGGNPFGGGGSPFGGGGFPQEPQPASNSQFFNNATFSSWGDPHQKFTGNATGQNITGSANDMGSQTDLVDANASFWGGYQVSTQTTAPNSSGITYNASASVSMGDGAITVSMGKDGQTSIMDNGQNVQLAPGQSTTLSNGATVAMASNGAVTISDQNDTGGSISTTLSWNGSGVDVNGSAQNVELGGYDVGLGQSQSPDNYQLLA